MCNEKQQDLCNNTTPNIKDVTQMILEDIEEKTQD